MPRLNGTSSNSAGSSASTPQSSRLQEYLATIPAVTLILTAINIFVHLTIFLFSISIYDYTFNAYLISYNYEFYRIFTSAFIHGGLFHIGMNMLSLLTLGTILENNYGSIKFAYVTFIMIILAGLCSLLVCW